MTTKILLGCDAQLVCWSGISVPLAARMALDRHVFACALEWIAGVILLYRSAAERSSSIRWSVAG